MIVYILLDPSLRFSGATLHLVNVLRAQCSCLRSCAPCAGDFIVEKRSSSFTCNVEL